MGLFKKKSDPLADRARSLNDQIAALEAQIRQLSEQPSARPDSPFAAPAPAPAPTPPQPRLRSTAQPRSGKTPPAPEPPAPARPQAPIFEEVDHARLQAQRDQSVSEEFGELGVRKNDIASLWRRMRNNFRGPATNNPKLVNYLAAGSIQGLRPMRYEKRVAFNRFVFFAIVLVLALWGLVTILMSRR